MASRAPAQCLRLPFGLRLGIAALFAPASVLVPGARLLAAARRRYVRPLLAASPSISHFRLLLWPLSRLRTQARETRTASKETLRALSDGPRRIAASRASFSAKLDGPGGHPGRHPSRGERYLLTPVERNREPCKQGEIYVQLHALQPTHTERRERVFALQAAGLTLRSANYKSGGGRENRTPGRWLLRSPAAPSYPRRVARPERGSALYGKRSGRVLRRAYYLERGV